MMKQSTLLLVLALFVGVAYSASLQLTDDSFSKYFADNPKHVVFVDFFAPWCGHCKRLDPVWEEVADEFLGQEVNTDGRVYRAAKVDATVNKATATAYQVNGYPTLILFRDGYTYRYKGPRTKEKLIEFAQYGYQEAEGVKIAGGEESLVGKLESYKETIVRAAKQLPYIWNTYPKGVLVLALFAGLIGIMFTLVTCFSPPKIVKKTTTKKTQ